MEMMNHITKNKTYGKTLISGLKISLSMLKPLKLNSNTALLKNKISFVFIMLFSLLQRTLILLPLEFNMKEMGNGHTGPVHCLILILSENKDLLTVFLKSKLI